MMISNIPSLHYWITPEMPRKRTDSQIIFLFRVRKSSADFNCNW